MKIDILGVRVDNVSFEEAVNKVEEFIGDKNKHYVVTPNPEIGILAQKDHKLRQILNSADLAIPDGIGLIWASRILGSRLKERVTGVDLMEKFCQVAEKKGFSVGLLGGKNGVASLCAAVLKNRFEKLKLVVFDKNQPIYKDVDILFVAMGAPKQEKWIGKNLPKIPVKVAMGVGGAFEMITGAQIRAPKILQNLGLEWLWRLITQPWRVKRQLALLVFVYFVIKQKLKGIRE